VLTDGANEILCVLLDFTMPGVDGKETSIRLREILQKILDEKA